MKRWTVMVIPEGTGNTQSYTFHSAHVWMAWCVGLLLIALSFTSAFMCKRYLVAKERAQDLVMERVRDQYAQNTQQAEAKPAPAYEEVLRNKIERDIRAEYEKAYSAVTSELQAIYDLEAQIREIQGLPPRSQSEQPVAALARGDGGKGGGPSVYDDVPAELMQQIMRPQSFISGLAHPSADLMVQEIRLREESLQALMDVMLAQRERMEHTPSIWPTTHGKRVVTSTFGQRRHPIINKVRHHDGTDISAPHGAKVVATAKGTVTFSGFDRYLGNLVKIDHGYGVETWYAHLSQRTVNEGEEVERGEQIGKLGNTGMSTGPHLHYEVRINDKPVDSSRYF